MRGMLGPATNEKHLVAAATGIAVGRGSCGGTAAAVARVEREGRPRSGADEGDGAAPGREMVVVVVCLGWGWGWGRGRWGAEADVGDLEGWHCARGVKLGGWGR